MALNTTHLQTIANTLSSETYSFFPFTPAATSLLIVIVAIRGTAVSATISDTAGVAVWTTHEDNGTGLAIFTGAVLGVPSRTIVQISITGDAGTGRRTSMWECTGDVGRPEYVQSDLSDVGAGGTTPQWTPDVVLNTNNAYFACINNTSNPAAVTEPASWTEDADTGHVSPTAGWEVVSRNGGESGLSVSWGSTSATAWRLLGIEIAEPTHVTAPLAQLAMVVFENRTVVVSFEDRTVMVPAQLDVVVEPEGDILIPRVPDVKV